jgi:mono/diheme cytochrome c family protein
MGAAYLAVASLSAYQETTKTTWDGLYTEAQGKRGEQAYTENCAKCHGPDLAGADAAPPLMGGEFNSGWNDLTVGDLFERLRITMPADKAGSLSRQINADIVAYLLAKNGFPTGQTELPTQTEILKTMKIQTQKP